MLSCCLASAAAWLLALVPAVAEPIARFAAPEAHQGIAVDSKYLYAIDSASIGKYEKSTGQCAARRAVSDRRRITHLNSGVVVGKRLYCAHSNYPRLPMASSIEIFDTRTLEHVGSHSFGITNGSCTWIDRHDDFWWIVFAHYDKDGGYPDKDVSWTHLVKCDNKWSPIESWVFPIELVSRFTPYSCSGGAWGPDDLLYCTGHGAPELYVLSLPQAGSSLELLHVLQVDTEGQGIAFDWSEPGILYGIRRSTREVIRMNVRDLERGVETRPATVPPRQNNESAHAGNARTSGEKAP